jgi:RNA polymerase sigma-70 factor, ECF subfamily
MPHVTFTDLADIISMAKDTTDFHRIYVAHSEAVYRFAFWLTGDSDEAKDITSETFVRAWTGGAEIRFESVKSYLLTIARHLYLRRKERERRRVPFDEETADESTRADESAEARSELENTEKLIQALPEIDRTVLMLRAEDVSYDEIARITGLTVSTAKVRVFRARARLLEKLVQQRKEPT